MKAKYRKSNGDPKNSDPKAKKLVSSNPDVASEKKGGKAYRPMTADEYEKEMEAGNLDDVRQLTREEQFEMYSQYADNAPNETERRKWKKIMNDMLREDYATQKKGLQPEPITNMTEYLDRKREEDLARRKKLYGG